MEKSNLAVQILPFELSKTKIYSSSKGISNTYCCKGIKIILIHKAIQQTPRYICKQLEEISRDSFNFHM